MAEQVVIWRYHWLESKNGVTQFRVESVEATRTAKQLRAPSRMGRYTISNPDQAHYSREAALDSAQDGIDRQRAEARRIMALCDRRQACLDVERRREVNE